MKELEARTGIANVDESLGEVRVLSVTGWPAHDLLMIVRDDVDLPVNSEISGLLGEHYLIIIMSDSKIHWGRLVKYDCV